MMDEKTIQELAAAIVDIFEKRVGGFEPGRFVLVAKELGFRMNSVEKQESQYTYHQKQQPGKGF